ncbi:hypothetical protein Tco_0479930, partial [Tanacetum coccineum]
LKKYGFDSCDPVDTPMLEKSKLDDDKEGKAVDPSHYHCSAYQKALKCGKKDLSVSKWLAIISDSNPVIMLKASFPPKRKLDLSMGIYSRAWCTL